MENKMINMRSSSQNLEAVFQNTAQQFKKQCKQIQKNFLRRKNLSLPRFNAKRISWYHQNLQSFNNQYEQLDKKSVLNHKSQSYIQGFFQNTSSRLFKVVHQDRKIKNKSKENFAIQKKVTYPQLLKIRFNLKKKVDKKVMKQEKQSYKHSTNFNLLDFGKFQVCQNKQINNKEIYFNKKIFVQNLKLFSQEQIFENRQNSCMVAYNNLIYQFCGQGPDLSQKYTIYNKIENTIEKNSLSFFKRINSSFIQVKNFLFIQGGQTNARVNGFKNLNDLIIFDLQSQKYIHINDFSLMYPEKRNHIIFVYKNYIYLWGGQTNNELDNVLYKIDIQTNKMKKSKIKYLSEFRTRHKCVQIGDNDLSSLQQRFHNNNQKPNKKNSSRKKEKNIWEIKQFIVYIFGGMNQNQMATNSMLTFKVKEKGQWVANYPPIQGKPPKPRIDHCFINFKQLNSLIICGGRNPFDKEEQCDIIYNDMFLFNLATYCYVNIKFDTNFEPRYNFNMIAYDQNLIIFGGLSNQNYLNNKINCYKINDQTVIQYQMLNKSLKKKSFLNIIQVNFFYVQFLIINKQCLVKILKVICLLIILFGQQLIYN